MGQCTKYRLDPIGRLLYGLYYPTVVQALLQRILAHGGNLYTTQLPEKWHSIYQPGILLSAFEFLELHKYSVPSHPCDQEPDRQMKPFPRLERPEFAAGSGAVLMLQGVSDHTALVAPGQKDTSPPE